MLALVATEVGLRSLAAARLTKDVTDATVRLNLLKTLNIVVLSKVKLGCEKVLVSAALVVLSTVKEPDWKSDWTLYGSLKRLELGFG